ncbi:MAG: hypothetical protein R3Y47_01155 [Lachnospiraceae bacterium]
MNTIKLFETTPVCRNEDVSMTYSSDEHRSASAPVALTFDYGLENAFLLN